MGGERRREHTGQVADPQHRPVAQRHARQLAAAFDGDDPGATRQRACPAGSDGADETDLFGAGEQAGELAGRSGPTEHVQRTQHGGRAGQIVAGGGFDSLATTARCGQIPHAGSVRAHWAGHRYFDAFDSRAPPARLGLCAMDDVNTTAHPLAVIEEAHPPFREVLGLDAPAPNGAQAFRTDHALGDEAGMIQVGRQRDRRTTRRSTPTVGHQQIAVLVRATLEGRTTGGETTDELDHVMLDERGRGQSQDTLEQS